MVKVKVWREKEKKKEEMASFASSATTGGARKHAWTKRERKERKKIGEKNGQLRFVRHHGWHTQAHQDQNFE